MTVGCQQQFYLLLHRQQLVAFAYCSTLDRSSQLRYTPFVVIFRVLLFLLFQILIEIYQANLSCNQEIYRAIPFFLHLSLV